MTATLDRHSHRLFAAVLRTLLARRVRRATYDGELAANLANHLGESYAAEPDEVRAYSRASDSQISQASEELWGFCNGSGEPNIAWLSYLWALTAALARAVEEAEQLALADGVFDGFSYRLASRMLSDFASFRGRRMPNFHRLKGSTRTRTVALYRRLQSGIDRSIKAVRRWREEEAQRRDLYWVTIAGRHPRSQESDVFFSANLGESRPRHERSEPILDSVKQRTKFYRWAYELLCDFGHQIRWPIAAHVVSSGVRDLTGVGQTIVSNDLESALRTGNQVIHDDVVEKLRVLFATGLTRGPLRGPEAVKWDAITLAEEQYLVQAIYDRMSESDYEDMYEIASGESSIAALGARLQVARIEGGMWVRGGIPPFFNGKKQELREAEKRWAYGIILAETFSALEVEGSLRFPSEVKARSAEFRVIYEQLNFMPGVHRLDAALNDHIHDKGSIKELVVKLTEVEAAIADRNQERRGLVISRTGATISDIRRS